MGEHVINQCPNPATCAIKSDQETYEATYMPINTEKKSTRIYSTLTEFSSVEIVSMCTIVDGKKAGED